MPRKPRFMIPGVPVHIVQRGHCREPVFFDEADYQERTKGSDPFKRASPTYLFFWSSLLSPDRS